MFKKQRFFNNTNVSKTDEMDSLYAKFTELELDEVDKSIKYVIVPIIKKPQLKESKPIFNMLYTLSSQKKSTPSINQLNLPNKILFPDNHKPNIKLNVKASNIFSKYIRPIHIESLRTWALYNIKNDVFNFEEIVQKFLIKPEIKKLLPNRYCLGTDIVPSYLCKKTMNKIKSTKDIKSKLPIKSMLKVFKTFKGHLSNENNFAFIGYPKSGKSTILGNVLLYLQVLHETLIKKTEWEATKMNSIDSKISWLLDSSINERIYKETISSSLHYIEINNKSINLIDCPGSLCYYYQIVKAVMKIDIVIVTINLINNWNPQLEEFIDVNYIYFLFHLFKIFSIDKLKIIFVNCLNIDTNVPLMKIQSIWKKFSKSNLTCILINDLSNIQSSEIKSIVDYIANCPLKTNDIVKEIEKPLLMEIIDIFKPIESNLPVIVGHIIRGGICSGINNPLSKALICPENLSCFIKSLKIQEKDNLITRSCGFSGHVVEFTLPEIRSEDKIKIGSFICDPEHPLIVNKCFQVQLVIFDCDIKIPIINGMKIFMWTPSRNCFCELNKIKSVEYYHKKKKIIKKYPRIIQHSECVVNAQIVTEEFLAVEFRSNHKLDVFLLFSELTLFSAGKFIDIGN